MENVLKFKVAIDKVVAVSNGLLTENSKLELKKRTDEFEQELNDSQYIKIPIIGIFSSGKSSLLNVFTQKSGMLPVDTLPETAVAYELYYAKQECVDLYRDGKKIETKPLTDIKTLVTRPGDIAKVYCSSNPIKELQEKGIILVDMPGIGSGIERHDAAIFNYINKGAIFVLLVDADQGALRGSTLAFMQELSKYGLNPAVIVSKTDKKPEGEVKNIVEYISYQLNQLGDKNPHVATLCSVNNDISGFTKYIEDIDVNSIISKKLGKLLNIIILSIANQLKIRRDLRSKDIVDVDDKIAAIESEINNVKTDLPLSNTNADTPEKSTRDIIDSVKEALVAKADDIAQMIINKENVEEIKSLIISTVRSAIITSLQDESEQYATSLGSAVQDIVKKLSAIEIDNDFFSNFDDILVIVNGYIAKLLNFGGIYGKIAAFILPVLPAILPKLMKWLFGKSDDDILQEVRAKVISACEDKIAEGLYPTILKIVTDNQKRIQEKMKEELISKMEKAKEALSEKIEDANKSKDEIESEIAQLNNAIAELDSISKTV